MLKERIGLALGVGTIFLSSCNSETPQIPTNPSGPLPATIPVSGRTVTPDTMPSRTPERTLDIDSRRLVTVIENLPPSRIKNLMISEVSPYFGPNPPRVFKHGDVEIPVKQSEVRRLPDQADRVYGSFTMRGNGRGESKMYYPTNDTVAKVPLLFTLQESEYPLFEQNVIDGIPLLNMKYTPSVRLFSELSPIIEVQAPPIVSIDSPSYHIWRQSMDFTLLKEGIGFLLGQIYLREVINDMTRLNLPRHIPVQGGGHVEILSHSFVTLGNNDGRAIALHDIAAYGIALDAIRDTDRTFLSMDPLVSSVMATAPRITADMSEREILRAAYNWAVSTPQTRALPHTGNINKIP